jgi:Ca2+-binding RTX toxin-like protein
MRASRFATVLVMLLAFSLVPVGAAGALTVTMSKGVLTITGGSAAETLEFTCNSSSRVALNGKKLGGGIPCSSVKQIYVYGGGGKDTIDLRSVDTLTFWRLTRAHLFGGDGNDFLAGSEAPNTFNGGAGGDLMSLGPANDTATGGPGNDGVYILTETNVTLTNTTSYGTSTGSDTLKQVETSIVYVTGSSPVTVDATSTSRWVGFFGGPANDTFQGGLGDDAVFMSPGADNIDGGPGTDRIISATPFDQTLWDTALSDGSGMVDTLASIEHANLQNDAASVTLDANAFSGTVDLDGGEGNDTLKGTVNDDYLEGGPGSDSCLGAGGNDTYKGCEVKT